MSPKLRGRDIPRSTGRNRTRLTLIARWPAGTPVCTVCGWELSPWHTANGLTTHGEDPA